LGNKGSSQVKIKTGHLFMSAISRPISCKRLGLVDPVNNHPQVPARRFIHSESPKPSSAVRIEASGTARNVDSLISGFFAQQEMDLYCIS
jgi:hypothetical protein